MVTKFDEKWMPQWSQQVIKIEPLGANAQVFSEFVRFWKDFFFDEFLVPQKVGQQIAEMRLLAAVGDFPRKFWQGWRVGRCPLKLFRAVLESWMNSGIGFCTLVPRQARGGGFQGLRPTRRPPNMEHYNFFFLNYKHRI